MKRYDGLASIKNPFQRAVVTLGNFDGMHRGHRMIIAETVRQARDRNGTAVAYTFYPHPVKMLAPDACPPLIQTIEQRLEMFTELGVDACVIEPFSLNLAHQTPKEFFDQVLVKTLGAQAVVVGYDFTFGVHRRGTVEVLKHLGEERNIAVTVIEAQFMEELLISSTEIRRDIARGDVNRATRLMESPFTLRGTVVPGKGLGKTLGAHTANIDVENELMPLEGVYITHTKILDEDTLYPSISSLGIHPTFDDGMFTVETHLIDFEGQLVGKKLDIFFHQRMRGQIAFDSPDTLRGQIERDIEAARRWHEDHRA